LFSFSFRVLYNIHKMNSKKIISVLLFLSAVIISCSKDKSDDPAPAPSNPPVTGITSPPGTYTQKVLLEYHTAAWCGTCVDAEVKRDVVLNTYPGKSIAVAYHQSDGMQIPLFMTIDATFSSNPTYGMINRAPSLNSVLLNRTQ